MGICYIVGAGEFTARDFQPSKEDFVIAADGGYRALLSIGNKPDLLMGDFDSLGNSPLPTELPIKRFPVQKDDTDTGLAIARGWELGYRVFHLYGCSGGRVDHLIANFQCMCRYSKLGAQIKLIAQDYDAFALTNGSIILPDRPRGTVVSVFAHGVHAEGVNLQGLFYPLSEAILTNDFPLGVSNQRIDENATVSVRNGTLLILQRLCPEP